MLASQVEQERDFVSSDWLNALLLTQRYPEAVPALEVGAMWRSLSLIIVSLALGTLAAIAGCNRSSDGSATTSGTFGRFEGEVVASWLDNGRDMLLRETFRFVDSANREWVAPAGSVVNGASIPAPFWSLIGGPFEGKYRNASVVHDVGCEEMTASWEDVHWMFYEACRCAGVDEFKAKTMYYAVYHFGPRWEPIVETVVEPQERSDGQVVMQEVPVKRMARLDPPPPTAVEIDQIRAYVSEENPSPDAIRRLKRDELRQRPNRRGAHPGRPITAERSRPPEADQLNQRSMRAGGPPPSATHAPEQDYIIDQVRQYIDAQAGEPRPAQYTVEANRGNYRVYVQYLAGEDGSDSNLGSSIALVSRRGQILEFVNTPQ